MTETNDAVTKSPTFDPFAGVDVGRITPSIDFSKAIEGMSSALFQFSQIMPKMDPAIFDTIKNIDFGIKPVIDAAVLRNLATVVGPKSIFPPGFFDAYSTAKFPEIEKHPDAVRAIESITLQPGALVPILSGSDELEAEDIIDAELVEDERTPGINVNEGLLVQAARQSAALERMTDLLGQSIIDAADARAESAAAKKAAAKSERSKWVFGTIITVLAVLVAAAGLVTL
ncbi:hypothetical protein BH09ACT1_BH09ACT1_12740 [soil metagenome]